MKSIYTEQIYGALKKTNQPKPFHSYNLVPSKHAKDSFPPHGNASCVKLTRAIIVFKPKQTQIIFVPRLTLQPPTSSRKTPSPALLAEKAFSKLMAAIKCGALNVMSLSVGEPIKLLMDISIIHISINGNETTPAPYNENQATSFVEDYLLSVKYIQK